MKQNDVERMKTIAENGETDAPDCRSALTWRKPVLTELGDIRELTQGGVGVNFESSEMLLLS